MTTTRKKALVILAAWGLVAAGAWAYFAQPQHGGSVGDEGPEVGNRPRTRPVTPDEACETTDRYIKIHCDAFGIGGKK